MNAQAIAEVLSRTSNSRTAESIDKSNATRKAQEAREIWLAENWGNLRGVTITDDPNFQPTDPLPAVKKQLKRKKPLKRSTMSQEELNDARHSQVAEDSSNQMLVQKDKPKSQDDFLQMLRHTSDE